MDWLSTEFWLALASIVMIDLVLAGDNAIVIGMAARNLPKQMQTRVIVWGTAAAIVIRAILTMFVVFLLKIPFLLTAGGLLLIWIAYSLLATGEKAENVQEATSVSQAIRTIVIADVVMGLDNVLAIAGASHGSFVLVVLGLLISVPIMIWGSTVILKLIERYPIIIYIGSGVLAFTAAKMITEEPLWVQYFEQNVALKWTLTIGLLVAVMFLGRLKNRQVAT